MAPVRNRLRWEQGVWFTHMEWLLCKNMAQMYCPSLNRLNERFRPEEPTQGTIKIKCTCPPCPSCQARRSWPAFSIVYWSIFNHILDWPKFLVVSCNVLILFTMCTILNLDTWHWLAGSGGGSASGNSASGKGPQRIASRNRSKRGGRGGGKGGRANAAEKARAAKIAAENQKRAAAEAKAKAEAAAKAEAEAAAKAEEERLRLEKEEQERQAAAELLQKQIAVRRVYHITTNIHTICCYLRLLFRFVRSNSVLFSLSFSIQF